MKQAFWITTLLLFAATSTQAQEIYNVKLFRAKGDGRTDDALAIQRAIDAYSKAGGGKVILLAPRVFLAGPLNLKSNVQFHVDAGAKLLSIFKAYQAFLF